MNIIKQMIRKLKWKKQENTFVEKYQKYDKVFDVRTSKSTDNIKIMSFNLRCLQKKDILEQSWYNRAKYVIEIIERYSPDIIGFQEVSEIHLEFLEKHLEGYNFYCVYRDNSIKKESPLIAYRQDRFEALFNKTFWLSPTPEIEFSKYPESYYPRNAENVILKDKVSGKIINYFNTHLEHLVESVRTKQSEILVAIATKNNDYNSTITVIGGDMNCTPSSKAYANFTSVFDDSAFPENRNAYTFHNYNKNKIFKLHIDYIFVSKGTETIQSRIITDTFSGEFPSDHYPIMTTIKI